MMPLYTLRLPSRTYTINAFEDEGAIGLATSILNDGAGEDEVTITAEAGARLVLKTNVQELRRRSAQTGAPIGPSARS